MQPERAILLVRISDDREGEALGVGRQETDGRTHADKIGWRIAQVIVENDVSAFKRRKVTLPDGTTALRVYRPGLRESLQLLASGERDGLLVYDLDRYTRDPRDLEDLIDLVEQKRVPVRSVTGSLRLDTDADITMARVMVAVANKSSRDTSRRVARKHEQLAEQGKPSGGGRRAYGYDADGMTIRQAEADGIKKMAQLLLDGGTLYDIAEHLTLNGPPPAYVEKWSTASVRTVLSGPRIAGLRVFRGQVVGDAAWPAILDLDTWDQVQVKLAERRRLGGERGNRLVHWLNGGTLLCGLCGHELASWSSSDGSKYWCATPRGGCGKIAIHAGHTEKEVKRQILGYLSNPAVLANLRDAAAGSPEAAGSARYSIAEDEQQLKELAGMWARREVTLAEYSEARRVIVDRIKQGQEAVTAALPSSVRAFLQSDDITSEWEAITPAQRRDLVRGLVPRGYRVMPHAAGVAKTFDASRLVPVGRE
jgi:DNA invertase Pin-like site-specific DNA recombinase